MLRHKTKTRPGLVRPEKTKGEPLWIAEARCASCPEVVDSACGQA